MRPRCFFFSRFSTAVRHSTTLRRTRARARGSFGQGGAVGHTAGGERASPARTPSRPAQGNAFDSRTMVFELAVVETETTVPRGGEGVCPALASAVALATRSSCCQAFCAMATRELGAREVVKRAITKSLARTTQTAAKKKKPAKKAAKKPKAKKAKKVPRSLQRHEL